MSRLRVALGGALGLALALSPSSARAGNSTHIRTPVSWTGAPCMTVIDRSVDPVFPLTYAVPYEDTNLTEDEVADSRRHQFFAMCRDRREEALLPNWIHPGDVEAAVAKELGDPAELEPELDILESSAEWAGCWVRLNADDARRPISHAAAAEPVAWDTTGLAAGAWVIEGYTWEPWFNLWTHRPGVFKIVDDADPASSPPAAAFDFDEQPVFVGEEATISGCVDAMAGSTMTLAWGLDTIGQEPTWEVFEEGLPVEGASFELGLSAPQEAAGSPIIIRAQIVDPVGRSWTAYSHQEISVLSDSGCDEGSGSFLNQDCGESGEDEASGSGDSGGGGGCTVEAPGEGRLRLGGTLALGLAVLALFGVRRRVRSR